MRVNQNPDFPGSARHVILTVKGAAEKKIRQADGTYLFKENTDLKLTDGQPMVSSEKPVVIKAEGKRLAFTSAGDQNGTVSTVQQNSKDNLSITAKELVVKAGNKSGRSEGIHLQNGNKQNAYKTDITGDVTIQSKGKGYALGAYAAGNSSLDIHGNMTIKGEGGTRSEERRVGKECRSRWSPYH